MIAITFMGALAIAAASTEPSDTHRLTVDAAAVYDDLVVVGDVAVATLPTIQINEAIQSPPVSLASVTDGLVLGDNDILADGGAFSAEIQRALDRATRTVLSDRAMSPR